MASLKIAGFICDSAFVYPYTAKLSKIFVMSESQDIRKLKQLWKSMYKIVFEFNFFAYCITYL